jgi:multimeric flavodoxin WrbA
MIWVGQDLLPGNNSSTGSVNDLNRLGSFMGAMAQANADQGADVAPIDSDLRTAEHLGERVATITKKLHG